MIFYIQIDKDTDRVLGYGSDVITDNIYDYIEVDGDNGEYSDLLRSPLFYKYDRDKEVFIKDTGYEKEILERQRNYLTNEQLLGQAVSDLEIKLLLLTGGLYRAEVINLNVAPVNKAPLIDVDEWRDRYRKKWANDTHIETLVSIGAITTEQSKYIRDKNETP